ncbi:MAG: Rieske 2Fe-2S domain-containing protein, partial [Alphaproteobacteria bacterium]|nr:Rieske 2Fe-2S domain-containing protein [Alphaproteobacteria bacterium]
MDVVRTSVILIRGKDNTIRAFHNVCPHRGNRVIPEVDNETFGKARADYLTCRFHGWVFDSTGAVRNVSSLEKFPPYFRERILCHRLCQC